MRITNRSLLHSAGTADRSAPIAGDSPKPGEVLTEIGALLAVHLALAIAVTIGLHAFGIA